MKLLKKIGTGLAAITAALSMAFTAGADAEPETLSKPETLSEVDSLEPAAQSSSDRWVDQISMPAEYNIRKIETNKEYTEQILFSRYLYEKGTWSLNNSIGNYVDWFDFYLEDESTLSVDFTASMDKIDMFMAFITPGKDDSFYKITDIDITEGSLPYYMGNHGIGYWSLAVLSSNNTECDETIDGREYVVLKVIDKEKPFNIKGRMTFENIPAGTECILGIKQCGLGCGYGTQLVTFRVNAAPVPKNVRSIAIKSLPKTEYFTGDKLDLTGGEISVVYEDGTSAVKPMTVDMISGFSSASGGKKDIKVTYGGLSVSFTVNITEIKATSLKFSTLPKSNYYIGDKLDISGVALLVELNNGTKETVPLKESMLSGFSTAKAGKRTVTVTYRGMTLKYDITVSVDPAKATVVYTSGTKTGYAMLLSDAFDDIGSDTGEYTVTVKQTITDKKLTFPKKTKLITLNSVNGAVIRTTATSASVNSNTVLNCAIEQANGKRLTIKTAAGKTLTIAAGFAAGDIKGKKTSTLTLLKPFTAETISGFGSVRTNNNLLTVNKALKSVKVFDGKLRSNGSVSIDTIDTAELYIPAGAASKTSFSDVTGTLAVTVGSGEVLTSGEAVFTYKGKSADFYNKFIAVTNKDSVGNTLKPYLYGKTVKAEYADAMSLSYNGKTISYPSFETAFDAITDPNTDYVLTLRSDISIGGKLTLPKKTRSLTIRSSGSWRVKANLGKTKTLTAKCALSLMNIELKAGESSVAIKAGKNAVVLNNCQTGSITAASASINNSTVNGNVKCTNGGVIASVAVINGYIRAGDLTVNSEVTVKGTVTAGSLGSSATGSKLTAYSLSINKSGIRGGSYPLTLRLIDKTGALKSFAPGDIAVKTFKLTDGAVFTEGSILLETQGGMVRLKYSDNKLIV